MGQYYQPINIDKKEYLYSHDYGNGLKLMEHSWSGNNFVNAVVMLLGTKWAKDKLVWAGDYADHEDGEEVNLHALADESYNKIKPFEHDYEYKYILNHTKQEFVRLESATNSWEIHPLPLLTCEGNEKGLGDYTGDDPNGIIGLWARHSLESIKTIAEIPNGYSQLKFDLKDDN